MRNKGPSILRSSHHPRSSQLQPSQMGPLRYLAYLTRRCTLRTWSYKELLGTWRQRDEGDSDPIAEHGSVQRSAEADRGAAADAGVSGVQLGCIDFHCWNAGINRQRSLGTCYGLRGGKSNPYYVTC